MSEIGPGAEAVTLQTCADEPIHRPSFIQPHGALFAFDLAGRLTAWGANAGPLLDRTPEAGEPFGELFRDLDPVLSSTIGETLSEVQSGAHFPVSFELTHGDQTFDAVVHAHLGRLIVELEARDAPSDEVASFVLKAHRAVDRLKRQPTLDALLEAAVMEVRSLTGFDRVMAYRFRHDESGEVVAEARTEELVPFLGQRYPASDIPAQARRLYVLNTLRMIADVEYQPVPMVPPAEVVDMSHCVLRSVSPIHIEYLRNMRVGASMSVSLVVGGKLWGLLACHHSTSRQVPYSIRMACDVLAQVISLTVQSLASQEEARVAETAATVRTRVMSSVLEEDDLLAGLDRHAAEIRAHLGADALVLAQEGKLTVHGDLSPELAVRISQSLAGRGTEELLWRNARAEWPEALQESLGKWVGLLALCFDPVNEGWLLALRVEQVETVRWGGRPEKQERIGPLGARLTPRGSFDEWQETVRDQSVPWSESTLSTARQLLHELRRTVNARYVETDRARTQLLAMLGHDLRDPLNSITLAATALGAGVGGARMGQRIQTATGRMQRLVEQVLDFSRVRAGLGLDIRPAVTDVAVLVRQLAEDADAAHPGSNYQLDVPTSLVAEVDSDRVAQVVSNLLSNARHHGEAGLPIRVELAKVEDTVQLRVANAGPPIDPELVPILFDPFKRQSQGNPRNRTGLGLGLYIAREIVLGHGGTLRYHQEGPLVVFTVTLPREAAVGGAAGE